MSTGGDIVVRRAEAKDAAALVDLIADLSRYLKMDRPQITAEDIRRDGFGADPWFVAFLAERAGQAVGYAIANRAYSTDPGEGPGLFLADLFVDESLRGTGLGRDLMRAVAAYGRNIGGRWIAWDVWVKNAAAYRFYEGLGAQHQSDVSVMSLDDAAIGALLDGSKS